MSIKATQVTKLYGQQRALDEVSFEINSGEVVGFLGPNGAGKSTMMKIISGYISPFSGQISVEGIDVIQNSMDARRLIGYLPEHNPLYLEMYVKEYLDFVAGVYKLSNREQKVSNMIERTGLGIEQNKKIGALSKGYRQRVGLAQSLIHDPKVLILDEPTSGLDPNQIVDIRNLISEVGKEKTVLLSTHIMQEVEAICDKIIILDKGKIVANDDTKTIQRQSSQKAQVVLFELNQHESDDNLLKISGVNTIRSIGENKWLIEAKAGDDIREALFSYAVQKGYSVLSMQAKERSLEDVFQELTGKAN